jgi:integrase
MLTNAAVKAARPRAAAYKLTDVCGLHLYITPKWRMSWRWRFRWQGKEQLLTLGRYPDMSLDQARRSAALARERLGRGEDPRDDAAAETQKVRAFEYVARAWFERHRARWSATHAADVLASLERDIFPVIGTMPIEAITTPVVLAALRTLEARGKLETARRVRQRVSAVFKHAMIEGWHDRDPSAVIVDGLLPPPPAQPQLALVDLAEVRQLVTDVDALDAPIAGKLAARFLMLTAVRMGALRGARWDEIEDLDGAEPVWRVPAARMKLKVAEKAEGRNDHLVPLAPPAVAVLCAARAAIGGELLFGDLSEGAIGALYKRAGYGGRHVPHGCRASFSTILNQRFPAQRVEIDRALGHVGGKKDEEEINRKVEGAYNRGINMPVRRHLFDAWAGMIEGAPIAADVDEGSAEAA